MPWRLSALSLVLILGLSLNSLSARGAGTEIFISPQGKDQAPGTLDQPIASQNHAQELAGVVILKLEADSDLAKAGLQADDVILEFNGKTIRDVADLVAAPSSPLPLQLKISRNQKVLTFSL